jgi:hypothetical protein
MSFILPSIGGGIIASPTAAAFSNTYSVDFDGTDDYATATLGSQVFDGDFSISAWFNASTSPQYLTLLQLGDQSAYTDGWRLYKNFSQLQFWDGVGGYSLILEGGSTSTSSWYHVAITRSGTACTLYLNGNSTDTGTSSEAFTSTAFKISFTAFPFNGLIDEVALWDSALSASDVAAIYNSGVPADLSSLSPVHWWRMGDNDGGTGTTVTDQGSGGNNGTLTNGPTFSTNVPVFNAYSVDLDGTDDYIAVTPSSSIDLYGFSAWFKSDNVISASSGIKGVLLGQGGSAYFLALGGNATGDFTNELITIRQSAQNSFAYTSASATIDTNWHHIAAAWSTASATTGGDGYDIYLDGVKVGNAGGTSTPSSPYTLSSAFTIGMRANGAYPFNGLIDEVAIFNSTLSASDVATLYNSGVPNDISSLNPVGWWRMGDNDGGTGTTITDQGSGSNDGTLTNGPTFSTTVPS